MTHGRRGHTLVLAVALCLTSGAGCTLTGAPREVTLVARGMTFVRADDPETVNPLIELRAGERVRLVLRNEAPGLIHDIQIPAWDVAVESVRAGQTAETVFTVPRTPGQFQYLCRPHAELMSGTIEVVP